MSVSVLCALSVEGFGFQMLPEKGTPDAAIAETTHNLYVMCVPDRQAVREALAFMMHARLCGSIPHSKVCRGIDHV